MADDNEESLLLAFKESGVEFVEEASRAVGELGESFKGVEQAAQEAMDVLTEEGTVLDDLRQKIADQKEELKELAQAHKAGLTEQSRYKEQTDDIIASLQENETVLKRLTAAEREQGEVEAKLAKEMEAARGVPREEGEGRGRSRRAGRGEGNPGSGSRGGVTQAVGVGCAEGRGSRAGTGSESRGAAH